MGEPAAIELEGLGRHYGERPALREVTLTVPAGSTLAVLGRNGAGKSTLLRVLATLLRPHAGIVRVLGRVLPSEAWAVRGRLGFIAHEPLLYRDLTGRENLDLHARLHKVDAGRTEELLDRVEMGRRANDPVRELSRGMVQRVAAARAVLHDPPLLLVDEPSAGLDADATQRLLEPLRRVMADRATLLITHDLALAAEADEIVVLRDGRIAEEPIPA